MSAPCCYSGFKHEGTPLGKFQDVNGVNTYIATPSQNKAPKKAILFLSDVFGLFDNNLLLTDQFANSGYLTILPDLFSGDQVPVDVMESGKFDFPSWASKHGPGVTDPIVNSTLKYMKEVLGVDLVGAVGYCYGAIYVNRFLKSGQIHVGYHAHPSGFDFADVSEIKGPLSIAAAEIDPVYTPEIRHGTEDILIRTGQPWQINLFSGVSHGFAVRCDLSDPQQKWAKEQAFSQAVSWFNRHL
ncbi:hypothetical protein N7468_003853 [Penicillium chermesinum]|uniref:Dienelactone hydrolase domain-containing protein n=1 Tax=Penicillium chermesinum TaxID=63820 RepID=A0A9W9P7G7_9EURO|nr:uncharacterized protein N7468_003853 [Penicillium chermesinum]KAJ5239234.1 hypothetical protein N7468_003853 [Penicillium chermesinum]KAJ6164866.1 hypothetical protein N7470_003538 [Penicillium chermesinum]